MDDCGLTIDDFGRRLREMASLGLYELLDAEIGQRLVDCGDYWLMDAGDLKTYDEWLQEVLPAVPAGVRLCTWKCKGIRARHVFGHGEGI